MQSHFLLSSSILLSTALSIPTTSKRDTTLVGPGFLLYPENCYGGPSTGTLAPQSSSDPHCFNLDGHAGEGSFIWPAGDKSYQAIFFTAADCPADKHEKQFDPVNGVTFTYTAANDVGANGTLECLGAIWSSDGAEGSVWMAPPSVPPPGDWPPPASKQ